MKILTPFSVLLFLLRVNVFLSLPNNGSGRFDGIDSLIDRLGIYSPIEGIGRERSMPIVGGIPISRNDEESFFKGYELIGRGQCKHVSNSFLESCYASGLDSDLDCKWECSLFDGCVGFHYEWYRDFGDIKVKCTIFPSRKTFTKCPEHLSQRRGTGYTMAEKAEELVVGPDNGFLVHALEESTKTRCLHC